MVVLNLIVDVHFLAELSLTGLHFIVLDLFFRREVSSISDDIVKSGSDLVPVQLHIDAIGLLQFHTFAAAVSPSTPRYSVRASALSVLVL